MLATVGRGGYGTYFIFGSFCFSMFIFTWFFIPETKGISLERMDELFGEVPRAEAEYGSSRRVHDGSDSSINKREVRITAVEGK